MSAVPAVLVAGLLNSPRAMAVGQDDAASGVRSALERGAAFAVAQLGRTDGFMGDPAVRIPLPPALDRVAKLLSLAGQQARVDALVLAMNRAAEAAVPQAKALLVNAVKSMSVEDALQIVRGDATSATRFFEAKTRQPLTEKFLPIVTQATRKVSLADRYNALARQAAGFGLVDAREASLESHVTAKALDGLFQRIGEEERRIRSNPVATGSAILQRVFGSVSLSR